MKAAVVVADFYADIAEGLLESCGRCLDDAGVGYAVYRVRGALELPPACARLAAGADVMVALGCVIRGETYHFEVVSLTAAAGIMQVQLACGKPIGNGVLTVENKMQAQARLDKGAQAAAAALALARLPR